MNRLLAATAIVFAMITSAQAGCNDETWSEEKENACNHGYETAAFEKVCPGMTVSDAKLRAKLDAKYRTNLKMKKYFQEYYDLAAAQDPDKLSGVMTMCFTAASGDHSWIKWDKAASEQLVADEKVYRDEKEAARKARMDMFYGKSN